MHYLKLIKVSGLVLSLVFLLSACDEIKRVKDIGLGTGHSAHELCSRVFVTGQGPELVIEDILIPKVYPLQWVWNVDIDREGQSVSVGAPFFSALNNVTAIYREAQGCTVSHGLSRQAMESTTIKPVSFSGQTQEELSPYWPLGNQGIHPEFDQSDNAQLNKAIDSMFAEPFTGEFEKINTYAVLVVKDGNLVAERYSPEHNVDNKHLGWSISKSITALLLGILHDEGKVTLEDLVEVNDKSYELRLRHVLNMASGLDYNEDYEGESDVSKMLYLEKDASAFARSRPFIHKPGEEFNYSTGDTQILADTVQSLVGGEAQDAYNFYQEKFFHKLGIRNAIVEHDASGTFIGGARMFMRARDFAKLGLLMAQKGKWQDEQIVSERWIDFMLTPSKAYAGYGGQTWLYEAETFGEAFPSDAYVLWGVLGQMIVVVPSENLVVVRLGAKGSDLAEGIELDIIFNPVLEMIRALSESQT